MDEEYADSLPLTPRMMTLSAWLSISAGLAWNVKGQPQPLRHWKAKQLGCFFILEAWETKG